MSRTDQILKWIGAGALLFIVLPVIVIIARDVPGMIREVKMDKMGFKGGWKQAHRPAR
jgi:hypothetical protein